MTGRPVAGATPAERQPASLGDDALRKDRQARGLRAAAARRPRRAAAGGAGEARQARAAPARTDFLLAHGGRLRRLRDLRDTAGVAAAQVCGSEEKDVGGPAVVSRLATRG